MYTARKRNNPFAAQSRQKRAEEKARAKAARGTKTTAPEPEQPTAVPYVHENEVAAADNLTEVPDVATIPASNDVDLPTEVDTESDVKLFEPLLDDEQPLGDLTEVVDQQRKASIDKLAAALDVPARAITPLVDAEPVQDAKRGRGRPRPQETIDRDNLVYAHLAKAAEAGLSKSELAEMMEEKEQQVYSSLRQLSKEGRARTQYVKDVSGYLWFSV